MVVSGRVHLHFDLMLGNRNSELQRLHKDCLFLDCFHGDSRKINRLRLLQVLFEPGQHAGV